MDWGLATIALSQGFHLHLIQKVLEFPFLCGKDVQSWRRAQVKVEFLGEANTAANISLGKGCSGCSKHESITKPGLFFTEKKTLGGVRSSYLWKKLVEKQRWCLAVWGKHAAES